MLASLSRRSPAGTIFVVGGIRFMPSLIATSLPGELHQGSLPPRGDHLREAGIDLLVLCAMEYQPSSRDFPGVEVVHCPLDDAMPSSSEVMVAHRASLLVSQRLAEGERVLVTCRMGLNRSGWVSSLALSRLGFSSRAAVELVQKRRLVRHDGRTLRAMFNEHFVADVCKRERS